MRNKSIFVFVSGIALVLFGLTLASFQEKKPTPGVSALSVSSSQDNPTQPREASESRREAAVPSGNELGYGEYGARQEGELSWPTLRDLRPAVLRSPAEPPEEPVVALLPSLTAKAMGGDANAAYYVYRALTFCRSAPTTEEQYQEASLRLLTTRRVDGLFLTDDTTDEERLLAKRYEICAGLDRETISEANTYLRIAAENAHPTGQVAYASSIFDSADAQTPQKIIDTGIALLEEAKSRGNADAFFWSGFYGINGSPQSTRFGSKESSLSDLIVAYSMYSQYGLREQNLAALIEAEFDLLPAESRTKVIETAKTKIQSGSCCSLEYGESWEQKLSK